MSNENEMSGVEVQAIQPDAKITLKHPGAEDVVLEFDPLTVRKNEWINHLVLLPWCTPHRIIGFVHPRAAETDIGVKPFRLHAAFSYLASIAQQALPPNKVRIVEGPRTIVPYDMVAPIDMMIGTCPSWVFLRDQSEDWKKLIGEMMLVHLVGTPRIEAPPPNLLVPNGR